MTLSQLQPYFIPIALVSFFAWRFLKFRKIRGLLPTLLKQGGVIVDVRTAGEYSTGSCEGSINIPLDELDKQAGKLDRDKPVILCCASGTRSGMAAALLKRKGFQNVVNAGPWKNTVT